MVKLDLLRHARFRPPCRIEGPGLGQVQRPVDQGMPVPAGIGEKHPDLAVLDAACGAGVLAFDAGRLVALLQEAGLVEHQHGIRIAEVLDHIGAQVIAHRIGIPVHAGEEVLHAIGAGIAGRFGQVPAVLALERREQALQIGSGASARFDAAEPGSNPGDRDHPVDRPSSGPRLRASWRDTSVSKTTHKARL